MKQPLRSIFASLAAAGILATVLTTSAPGVATAGVQATPEMCNAPSTPLLVINAHANGHQGTVPKFILNVQTDRSGRATGTMILGKGSGRLMVTDWCRVWQHDPNQPSGGDSGEPYPAGAITAHALGLITTQSGTTLVRADVRAYADGTAVFRVRYRNWTSTDGQDATATGSEQEGGWTLVPAQGWFELDQFKLRTVS